MQLNHDLLNACGVGHDSLDKITSIAKNRGLSAKLTGAGGGGFALACIPDSYSKEDVGSLVLELERNGFLAFEAEIGGLGVDISLI